MPPSATGNGLPAVTVTPAVSSSVMVTVAVSWPSPAFSQPVVTAVRVTVKVSSSSSASSSTVGMAMSRVLWPAVTVTGEGMLPTSLETAAESFTVGG